MLATHPCQHTTTTGVISARDALSLVASFPKDNFKTMQGYDKELMPSLRHGSAMLSSPRRPAITIRTFSSAEYCRRVARWMSRTVFSAASSDRVSAFDLISTPFGVKMSLNHSLPQSPHSVQLVLTGNNRATTKCRLVRSENSNGSNHVGKVFTSQATCCFLISRPMSREAAMIGALDGAIVEGRMRQDSFVGIGYEIQRYSWLAGQQLGDVLADRSTNRGSELSRF